MRYFGEPVALVAAEHPEQARRAAEKIVVEYEPLEPVIDLERADEQPPIHAGRPTAGHGFRDDPRPNVLRSIVIRHGDPDAAGDVVVEGVYELGIQDQAFLGPESGLAVPDGEGGIDVYVATQWLHVDRDQVAPCLGLEKEQVRIHLAGVGGAFGGREDLSMQIHAAMLALHTDRPVKIVYNREESFIGPRPPAPGEDLGGASRDARRAARLRRARILLDGGAYASTRRAVISNAAAFALGPYKVDERADRGRPASTRIIRRAARCAASAPSRRCFADEAQMDILAAALEIDPVELRLLNALGPGDTLPTGQQSTGSLPVAEVIKRGAAMPVPEAEELPRDRSACPAARATRPAARASSAGSASRSASRTSATRRASTTTARRAFTSSRGRAARRRGPLRGGRGRPGRDERDPAGRRPSSAPMPSCSHRARPTPSARPAPRPRRGMTWMAAGAVRLACQGALAEFRATGKDAGCWPPAAELSSPVARTSSSAPWQASRTAPAAIHVSRDADAEPAEPTPSVEPGASTTASVPSSVRATCRITFATPWPTSAAPALVHLGGELLVRADPGERAPSTCRRSPLRVAHVLEADREADPALDALPPRARVAPLRPAGGSGRAAAPRPPAPARRRRALDHLGDGQRAGHLLPGRERVAPGPRAFSNRSSTGSISSAGRELVDLGLVREQPGRRRSRASPRRAGCSSRHRSTLSSAFSTL